MKTSNRLFIAAAALGLFASTGQTQIRAAAVNGDGITASPRVRQMLNERPRAVAVPAVTTRKEVTTNLAVPRTRITASPRASQMLNEKPRTDVTESRNETVQYKATGPDGITASPKARQLLNEQHRQTIEIAPLK